jgi:hypothetical protein
MSEPSDPERERPGEGVNLGKSGEPPAEAPFDPYRFGKPDHPIPAEYAPPGYTGPVIPSTPYPQQANPWAPPGGGTDNPFGNPPGTPYGGGYGQPPYGPYGPPPPPYPGYRGYAPPRPGNGKAVAGLVFGILSIVFFWLFIFDGIFVILGVIFSLIAMGEMKAARTPGRGIAVWGLVCSIVGGLLATVFTAMAIHAANQCGGFNQSNQPGWETCFREHLF